MRRQVYKIADCPTPFEKYPWVNYQGDIYPNVPFSALVSFGSSREPGLILLSQSGEMRFWDSIGLGLTGGDRTDSLQLDLGSNEAVTAFVYAEVCILCSLGLLPL